ncbi:MAG: cadmium-translocating P-type ATPase [Ruminococcaceae bacterium]|nr:cadmium-translocating P-type ATPase [Oscillospiraceae bacterium]
MEQKVYTLANLDCANCAAKIEAKFNALPEVEAATIVFATRQLRLTAEDPDGLIEKLTQIGRTVERDFEIHTDAHTHHNHHECHCHDHEHDHHHEHDTGWGSLVTILLGAGLFLAGILLQPLTLLASLPCFIAAYLILGWDILKTAAKNLLRGHVFDENFLMSIATIGAFVIQEYPEAVGVMLFYRVGRYFEQRAVERSRSQIMEAVDLRPETVLLSDGTVIPAAAAKAGDLVQVRPGDRIPLDGTVISGESRIDTAPITGESVPVAARQGDAVLSGCMNLSGLLTLRVEKPLSESMVTRILQSVENAAAGKPKIDRFITRFAKYYTPAVVAAAALVAIVPSLITGNWNYWVYTALSFLVMSCPCALVLSVPLAYFSGIGMGSKQGILFKSGLTMEAMANIKAVAMDKTGTLTEGSFTVRQVSGGDDVLSLCASCEQFSTHPIAVSILAAAKERGLSFTKPEQVEELAGQGIRAVFGGKTVLCGNEKLLAAHGISIEAQRAGMTCVYVAESGVLLGQITLGDTIKNDASEAVSQLHRMNIHTAILTGDGEVASQAIGKELGIDSVYARLLPEQKLETLQQLRKTHGSVMFVGDGINDAPVLSGADVGAAMGSGADAAIEAADVVFMTSKTRAIPTALRIAAQTRRIAWQNVIFALAVKLIVMILGVLGYASMGAAVFADSGVAVICILHALAPLYLKKSVKK